MRRRNNPPLPRTLIRAPTVPANDNARDTLKEFFLEFATRHNLSFTEIGQDDLWLLERGSGPEFIDFVAMLDVQPGPREMPINLRTTVPAFDLSIELDRVYGRGVEDNKAAIAAVLTLFHAMGALPDECHEAHTLDHPDEGQNGPFRNTRVETLPLDGTGTLYPEQSIPGDLPGLWGRRPLAHATPRRHEPVLIKSMAP